MVPVGIPVEMSGEVCGGLAECPHVRFIPTGTSYEVVSRASLARSFHRGSESVDPASDEAFVTQCVRRLKGKRLGEPHNERSHFGRRHTHFGRYAVGAHRRSSCEHAGDEFGIVV